MKPFFAILGERKHAENKASNAEILAALTSDKATNQALHDEHRQRLDDHSQWLQRLDDGQSRLGNQMDGVTSELQRLTTAIKERDAA